MLFLSAGVWSVEFFALNSTLEPLKLKASVYVMSAMARLPVMPIRRKDLPGSFFDVMFSGPSFMSSPSSLRSMLSSGICTRMPSPLRFPVRSDFENSYMPIWDSFAVPFSLPDRSPCAVRFRVSGRKDLKESSDAMMFPSILTSGSSPVMSYSPTAALMSSPYVCSLALVTSACILPVVSIWNDAFIPKVIFSGNVL